MRLLQDVLIKFKNSAGHGSPSVNASSSSEDAILLGALQRLVERATKNPSGLLDRLVSLVSLAKSGQLKAPGPKKPTESPKPPKPASDAVVSGGNQAKGKGKGKGKGKEQGKSAQPAPAAPVKRSVVEMEPTCWGGRLCKWSEVVSALEKGQVPKGQVAWCPDLSRALEAQALVKAHALKLEFACCVEQVDTPDL